MLSQDKLLKNFSRCSNWEEKYLYIIELGNYLEPLPKSTRNIDNLIQECQSKAWIVIIYNKKNLKFFGDSDASIVKGLIAILFVLYQNLTPIEVITLDINHFLKKLMLNKSLTISRLQGLESIINNIRKRVAQLI